MTDELELGVDPGSFRDPTSRVFIAGQRVLRGLRGDAVPDWEAAEHSTALADLVGCGAVVGSVRAADDLGPGWPVVLEHERVELRSYPYEWSFSMLRDAALLQLRIARALLDDGLITKDASAYNVLFAGSRPTFIDIGSIERLRTGEPWPATEQFARHFLAPLALQSVAGIPFQPWLRGSIDGIDLADAVAGLGGRRRFDRSLFVHLRLQARAQRRYAGSERDLRGELRRAGYGTKLLAAHLEHLSRAIERLRWSPPPTAWSDYSDRPHYEEADLEAKAAAVTDAVKGARADPLVLDLGANDGHFSRLALDAGARGVVATDRDHAVIDHLYRELQTTGEERILPLVLDLTDPTPAQGWRGRERPSFMDRIRPDLVLCLALVHHLAISSTVPFELIVDQLADFGCPVLVEVPDRDDPMVRRLLTRKRPGLFDHYRLDHWETAAARRFTVAERRPLPSGRRILYRLVP